MKKLLSMGPLLLLMSVIVVGASAFVYESAQQTVTQNIQEIATLSLSNAALGNIEEGETKSYDKVGTPALGDIISLTTSKANVYLHLDSDLDSQSGSYSAYTITVKFATVPGGSANATGDTACMMTLASPDPVAIDLDVAGSWTFDFEISTTADSVSTDTPTTVMITVLAESTA